MNKVSIIIPIYNAEKYLKYCLESVVNQTLNDIEIICVNDGSTDKSLDIINGYAKKDNRIVVVNKKNAGLGAAYNSGLEVAQGEYIGFVEPDDYIASNMYEELYNCTQTKPDIVRSDWFLDRNGIISKQDKFSSYKEGLYKNKNLVIFGTNLGHWSCLYKRENYIEKYKIRFTPSPGAAYQDLGFIVKAYLLADDIYVKPYQYYYYRLHSGQSISCSGLRKSLGFVATEYNEVLRYFNENKLAKDNIDLILLNYYTYILIERTINSYKYVKEISKIFNSDLLKSGYCHENFKPKTDYIYNLIMKNPLKAYIHIRLMSFKMLINCYF